MKFVSKFDRLWQASGRRLLGASVPSTWAPEPLIPRSESSWPDSVTWRPSETSPGWRLRSVSTPGILWECGRYVVADLKGTPAWEFENWTPPPPLFARVYSWKCRGHDIKNYLVTVWHLKHRLFYIMQRVFFLQINVENAQSDYLIVQERWKWNYT